MKVLFVCPWLPWPLNAGGKIRTFHLIQSAARQGAEIHLFAILEPGQEPSREVESICAQVHTFQREPAGAVHRWVRPKIERWFHSPALRFAVTRELTEASWDLVHLDELLLARILPGGSSVPVVQHHHKLDTVLYATTTAHKGAHRHFDLWKLRRLEAESARRHRHHLLCSEGDAEILRARHSGIECGVLPSGYDPEHFQPGPDPAPRDPDRLVFVGSMAYEPNVDAVVRFVKNILPNIQAERPKVTLDIVGRDPSPEVRACASDSVTVTGEVDDVRPYLERAALSVVPLRIGGGTRLKIVESLGMGCPVVATSIGAEGLELVDGREIALAESPESFATRTLELLARPEEAQAMALRGREIVRSKFAWDALGERLFDYWRGVIS